MEIWLANSFVVGATVALVLLWFRYMCSLLLAAQTSLDSSEAVARANSLVFPRVLRELSSSSDLPAGQLSAMAAELGHDFEVVTYLLRHMGESPLRDSKSEAWMLKIDYRMQSLWFRAVLPLSLAAAQQQLQQMAIIICHFADLVGQRSVPARA